MYLNFIHHMVGESLRIEQLDNYALLDNVVDPQDTYIHRYYIYTT